MSKNRKYLNKAKNSREYSVLQLKSEYDYCLICCKRAGSFYFNCRPSNIKAKNRHENGRILDGYKKRMYKSWKYNRKTQYKT